MLCRTKFQSHSRVQLTLQCSSLARSREPCSKACDKLKPERGNERTSDRFCYFFIRFEKQTWMYSRGWNPGELVSEVIWRQMICQEVDIHRVHRFPFTYCLPVLVCGDMWVQTGYFEVDNLKTKVECRLILGKCKVKRYVKCCWEQGLGIWSGWHSPFVAHAWCSLGSKLNWDPVQSLGSLELLPIPQHCLPLLIPFLSYHQCLAL